MSRPTIRLSIAASLDGYIADAAGGVGWLARFEGDGEDYGLDHLQAAADALVMGRATYDQVRGFPEPWPYRGKRVWVLTSRPLDAEAPPGVAALPDPDALLARLQGRSGLVWLVGGAATFRALLDRGAVDEIEVFVMPVLLGDGVRLLPPGEGSELSLHECEPFRSGVVRCLYGPRSA